MNEIIKKKHKRTSIFKRVGEGNSRKKTKNESEM